MSNTATLPSVLSGIDLFSNCDAIQVARLLTKVETKKFRAGETLTRQGEEGEHLFILASGSVEIVRGHERKVIKTGHFGGECCLRYRRFFADAVAKTDVEVHLLSRSAVLDLIKIDRHLESRLYEAVLLTQAGVDLPPGDDKAAGKKSHLQASWTTLVGWSLTILLPAVTLWFTLQHHLPISTALFSTIATATLLMWVFNLVDEFIPGIFAVLATLILGLVPVKEALSGFASESFFMAMSVLGLGTVIVSSGLSYRLILYILRFLPDHPFYHNVGLMLSGFLITPVLPTINGRVALIAPLLTDMFQSLNLKPKSKGATLLAISAFSGTTLLSAIFLSSKSVNFIVLGLLPGQMQAAYQWTGWLKAAAFTGVLITFFYFLTVILFFRSGDRPVLSKDLIQQQLKILGPVSIREWAAVFGFLVFGFAVATSSLHKIAPPWLGMCLLYALLLFGFLPKNEFRTKIDWTLLMFLAGMTSAIAVLNSLGMNKWIAANLTWVGTYMGGSFPLFILLLTGVILAIRLVLPISITIVISATVFVPLAAAAGLNEWLVGFLILVIGELWFFPYQCSYYTQFRDLLFKKGLYDEGVFLRHNALLNVLKLAALFGSIPVWKMMGIL